MMHSFTLLSVPVMILSLKDFGKLLLNNTHHEMTYFNIHQKSILSMIQPILATNIDRIKYYLGPPVQIL